MENNKQGGTWILKDTDKESINYNKNYKFDFSFITSEEIRALVKTYVWRNYWTKNIRVCTLYGNLIQLKVFEEFRKIRKIETFKDFTNNDISMYISFLRTKISDNTRKPIKYTSQKNFLTIVKSIIHWGQIHMPEAVPNIEIFTGNEYLGTNSNVKINFIPDDILIKINKALETEGNFYVKYGIIILETTGMRLGDLLNLTIDCIKPHPINGHTITWFDYKNRKERTPLPIPNECVLAVEKLIEHTKELRAVADDKKKYLFIQKVSSGRHCGKIMKFSYLLIKKWFNSFIMQNNILDENGDFYNLNAHQFRRTLATDMLSKGTNINIIKEVLGHTSISTTKLYYADVKDKERAEMFRTIGIIGNINQIDTSIIEDSSELEWFKANKDKCIAGLSDGYCTKQFIDGKICDRLLKRQKCYTCSRYITTPEYLEAHKKHLKSLEGQIENNIYGEHYVRHFLPTIEVLKAIICRLEELNNGRK